VSKRAGNTLLGGIHLKSHHKEEHKKIRKHNSNKQQATSNKQQAKQPCLAINFKRDGKASKEGTSTNQEEAYVG